MLDFDHSEGEFLQERLEELDGYLKQGKKPFFGPETYVEIIVHYLQEQNLSKALRIAKLGLEQHPFSFDLKMQLINIYALLGKLDQALDRVDELETLYPNDADMLYAKGRLLIGKGAFAHGIEYLEKMLPFAENPADLHFQLGLAYEQNKQRLEAIRQFRLVLEEDAAHEEALTELIRCADLEGKLTVCRRYYEQKIENDPYDAYAWYYKAMTYSYLGEFEEAIDALEFALAIDDEFGRAHLQLGHEFMNTQAFGKAHDSYLSAVDFLGESSDLFVHLGASKEKQEKFSKAIKYYKKGSELDDTCYEAFYGMGVCLSRKQKWLEAVHFLKKAVEQGSHLQEYWIALAEAEYGLGNLQAADELFGRASTMTHYKPDVWIKWSELYKKEGDFEQAIEIVKEGLESLPDEAELNYRVCAYNLLSGNYKEALEYLEISLSLDYDKHTMLYDFFPTLEIQKVLTRMINQFKD